MQPTSKGPLDTDYLGKVDKFVQISLKNNAVALLDPHNYARRNSNADPWKGKVMTVEEDGPDFADLWAKLAEKYKNNDKVLFGLMNEPHEIDTAVWFKLAQLAIDAIRKTGAKNLVMVPGSCFAGAHRCVLHIYRFLFTFSSL